MRDDHLADNDWGPLLDQNGHGQSHDIAPRPGLNQQICDATIKLTEILEINCKSRNQDWIRLDLSVILIDQFPEPREWMFRNSRPSKWKIVHLWFWEGFILVSISTDDS